MASNVKRVSVNLTERDLEAIRFLAEHGGTNPTVAVQRALQLSRFFAEEVKRGSKVLLRRPDGSMVEVLMR